MQLFGQRLLDPANREIGVRFLVAYLEAVRDLYGDGWKSDENVEILYKWTEMPIPAIRARGASYKDPNGQTDIAGVLDIQDYHISRGHTDFAEPLSIDQVLDETFLEEALARIGRFEE